MKVSVGVAGLLRRNRRIVVPALRVALATKSSLIARCLAPPASGTGVGLAGSGKRSRNTWPSAFSTAPRGLWTAAAPSASKSTRSG